MNRISLAKAKAHLSELVAEAETGRTVWITRHGKPAAQLAPVEQERRPIDLAALRSLTGKMPRQSESAADSVRQMRDESRY